MTPPAPTPPSGTPDTSLPDAAIPDVAIRTAALDVPVAAQPRLRPPGCDPTRSVLPCPRGRLALPLADLRGPAREYARLRRHRPNGCESRARGPGRARRARPARTRRGFAHPDRHRPEPSGRDRREPALEGGARIARAGLVRRALAAAPTRSIAGSSTSTVSSECGSRTRRCSKPRTRWCSSCSSQGVVDGLRVDHVDGLADPGEYLERLDRATGGAYTVVEKILARDETLPVWPVAGTTGYEAGDALTALAIDPEGRGPAGSRAARRERVRTVRRRRARQQGARPRRACSRRNGIACASSSATTTWCRHSATLTLGLDVYRLYGESPEDERRFGRASAALDARARPDALRARLLGDPHVGAPDPLAAADRSGDGQGPRGHRVLPVPGAPRPERRRRRSGRRPRTTRSSASIASPAATAASSAPVRTTRNAAKTSAPVCACSRSAAPRSVPGLDRWRRLIEPAPDVTPVESRFVAQTLLGAWPLAASDLAGFGDRIAAYLTKALREAKEQSNWLNPNEDHERRVIDCARPHDRRQRPDSARQRSARSSKRSSSSAR